MDTVPLGTSAYAAALAASLTDAPVVDDQELLRFLALPPGTIRNKADALAKAPAEATLPELTDEQHEGLSGTGYPEQNSVSLALGPALRENRDVAARCGISGDQIERLPALRGQMVRASEGAAYLGERGTDARLVLAGVQDRALRALLAFRDRKLGSGDEQERQRVRAAFAEVQAILDKWAGHRLKEAEKTTARAGAYDSAFATLQAEALVEDTMASIQRGEVPDPETLAEAAALYLEQQEKKKGPGPARRSRR